jgi:hypothetical protein
MDQEDPKKKCWKCSEVKFVRDFCRGGKDSVCKPCRYSLNAEWAKNNRPKQRPVRAEYMRDWRKKKKAEAEAAKLAQTQPGPSDKPGPGGKS